MGTYVNNLRLLEITTGDESGTWGTKTNTNLELIADAFGSGTEAITTNADTHTTTIADGAADEGRALFLKYTGTLDSACTITIAPNTVNKLWFIENATSGSQNIIISQGSGANITIGNGKVAAVYTDGAGSGAAVLDVFADLEISSTLTVAGNVDFNGDLDVDGTANLDVVDIDGAVDMASTLQVDGAITSNAKLTISSASEELADFYSTDTDAYIRLRDSNDSLYISSDNGVASFGGSTGATASNVNIDLSNGYLGVGTTSPSQALDIRGLVYVESASEQLADFYSSDTDAYIRIRDSNDSLYVSSDNAVGSFGGNAGANDDNININLTNGYVGMGEQSPDSRLHLKGDATAKARITLEQTTASLTSTIQQGSSALSLSAAGSQYIGFETNGSERAKIASDGTVSVGTDFLTVADGITTIGGTDTSQLRFLNGAGTLRSFLTLATSSTSLEIDTDSDLILSPNNAERMRIDSSGQVGIGTSAPGDYYTTNLVIAKTSSGGRAGMSVVNANDGTGRIDFADGTSGAAQYRGTISYAHNSTAADGYMRFVAGGSEALRLGSNYVLMANLPTSDPGVANSLYNDSGTLKISAG